MIRNRLAEIMFERDIKVVRLSKETGISRNTITNTASNNSEMLQLNTINKICKFLNITPCDFFEYIPVDIELTFLEDEKIELVEIYSKEYLLQPKFNCDLLIDIKERENSYSFDTQIKIDTSNVLSNFPTPDFMEDDYQEKHIDIEIVFYSVEDKENFVEQFNKIPKQFKKMIYNDLIDQYRKFLLSYFKPNDNPFIISNHQLVKDMHINLINDEFKFF
ncbi:MAG: helix-turn-helix transcriptional regulator [Staphylococcus epidermidis]|uniref:helix-turn-helix domain-containing protein n=1 Tax=Staphylococcaceae TaxID=90964 RepID=UPI001244620F|nr:MULTISPECIES: helix-turn-helix transcriptional regulator [Staphylococcaceae]KAA9253906.1 helix-turn-helix transcriptional regulator [Staphylococcus epidermidis]MCO6315250.1 helix-turn-helix transcriptional regulator [Staphylococcus epidermidis]MCO6317725.1 helix-turn-helix transcriptional regulator [Staphylococcus epidermidis]MDU0851022.1 helix-turn-helix transcriptional regulator [Staphylococcus epidermidis]MDU0878052.1 helix-turn-helix transcriptional regulator [Staphylococcus epidermidis